MHVMHPARSRELRSHAAQIASLPSVQERREVSIDEQHFIVQQLG